MMPAFPCVRILAADAETRAVERAVQPRTGALRATLQAVEVVAVKVVSAPQTHIAAITPGIAYALTNVQPIAGGAVENSVERLEEIPEAPTVARPLMARDVMVVHANRASAASTTTAAIPPGTRPV